MPAQVLVLVLVLVLESQVLDNNTAYISSHATSCHMIIQFPNPHRPFTVVVVWNQASIYNGSCDIQWRICDANAII